MCGICGIHERDGRAVNRDVLQRMQSVMRHRGPDGEGTLLRPDVGLGHLRLSIIDLEGGAQPIANEDDTVHVVFNGEIYNFVELREQLESHGHRFRTRSDTEVIVHAYEQWGLSCVSRFNGMFAFALWDDAQRRLFVARDHLGIKPVYYTEIGSRLLFASEIKGLLQDPDLTREVDRDALVDLFTFRYVPAPATMFEGVRKLPPGHYLVSDSAGTSVRRYWDWCPSPRGAAREEALIEEYCALLDDSVRIQLRSDVPLGLFLSSGVDSGVLLALMARHQTQAPRTFTIGFADGERTNEVDAARDLAQRFGAEHDALVIGPEDYAAYYERYLWDLEEPVGNESAAAFHFVSMITRRQVKVALTGQGADELWAGYDRHKGAHWSRHYARLPGAVTRSIRAAVEALPGRAERLVRAAGALAERDPVARFVQIYSFFNREMQDRLFNSAEQRGSTPAYEPGAAHRMLQRDVRQLDPLSQLLYLDVRTNLPDDLLMVADKTSMANSLEVRVPFLDRRLVEFVESLPAHTKLRGLTAKYLHKRALERWLPRGVVWARKKGFANPVEHWFRRQMKSYVDDVLLSEESSIGKYFDRSYVRQLLEDDRNGTRQYRRHIYLLVSFELWHRQFMRRAA